MMNHHEGLQDLRREAWETDRQQIAYFLELDWPVATKARLMSRYVQISAALEEQACPMPQAA